MLSPDGGTSKGPTGGSVLELDLGELEGIQRAGPSSHGQWEASKVFRRGVTMSRARSWGAVTVARRPERGSPQGRWPVKWYSVLL